jgi:hypothetical protein
MGSDARKTLILLTALSLGISNDKEVAMKITSILTYKDGGGNRRLRDYVKVTLGILVLVVAASGVGLYNRDRMVSEVMATPRPLDVALIPTATEQSAGSVSLVEDCPSNPADWTLTENSLVTGGNLKGLSPQCVREQVDKTAAWFYATSVLGYTRKDAAVHFGFSSIPMEYQFETGGITVITDFKEEPQKVNLRFPSDNTGLKEWRIDASGQPAVEFTFSGCFRTSSMSGGNVDSWGDGYPVVCQYFGDYRTKQYISDVNGKILTINGSENLRRLLWFGYVGEGNWVFLGFAKDWEYELSQIQNVDASTVNPSVMAEKYRVNSQPFPENWTTFTGQEFVDAFLQELDISE